METLIGIPKRGVQNFHWDYIKMEKLGIPKWGV
jgi:hypothetical protein